MNLSIRELNELIYSLGITAQKGAFVNKEVNNTLYERLYGELSKKLEFYDVNGFEMPEEDYKGQFKDWENETPDESSHFVSNEEADEDYRSTLKQDEQRYESSVSKDYDNHLSKLKTRGYITQSILDFVLNQGDATYTEMQDFYRKLTGSNSFSHHLYNLITPYKNRPTRRYLVKNRNGNYEVKVAGLHNWVVLDY
jgi:hypothetical protein